MIRLAAALVLIALLWLFHVNARLLGDDMILLVWLVTGGALGLAGFWQARVRRERLLSACLYPESRLQRRLRGGLLMLTRELAIGLVLALALVMALVRLESDLLAVALPGAALLWWLSCHAVRNRLRWHAHPRWLAVISARIAGWVVLMALLPLLVWSSLQQSRPDLEGVSLSRAVWHFVDAESARSGWLELALQLVAAADGLRQWLMQQVLPGIQAGPVLVAVGWIFLFAAQAVWVFGLSRLFLALDCGVKRYDRDSS